MNPVCTVFCFVLFPSFILASETWVFFISSACRRGRVSFVPRAPPCPAFLTLLSSLFFFLLKALRRNADRYKIPYTWTFPQGTGWTNQWDLRWPIGEARDVHYDFIGSKRNQTLNATFHSVHVTAQMVFLSQSLFCSSSFAERTSVNCTYWSVACSAGELMREHF